MENGSMKKTTTHNFFHKIANGRRRSNTIINFVDEGTTVEGDEKLLQHATNYYKNLFGAVNETNYPINPEMWRAQEKVSDEENEKLTRPFTEEEIKNALFQMEKNKAAGPDQIPIKFYQCCSGIIKQDIVELFQDLYEGRLDISRLNYGIITLLPKVQDAERIQQYRTICLMNCLYKWVTKTMTIRVEPVAMKVILKTQAAFIKGRNIMNGVLALDEVMHETKRGGMKGVVLKLDFEKAYDKISWTFLLKCLELYGFSTRWISWVEKVISGGTVSVKINNKTGPYFVSHKGVRQGDPLSPILFNFAADCLARMLREAQEAELIIGLADNLIPRGLAILQYADDTIVCFKDDLEMARNMKFLLYLYEMMSGLKINFDKTEVLMIRGDDVKVTQYAQIFICEIGSLPIKYLGVPISTGRLHVRDWLPLEEKIRKN